MLYSSWYATFAFVRRMSEGENRSVAFPTSGGGRFMLLKDRAKSQELHEAFNTLMEAGLLEDPK